LTGIFQVGHINAVTATTFEVLAEPNRRRILDLLRSDEYGVNDLVDSLGISQPSVSKHLKVLREAGLVGMRADAQRRMYSVRLEPLRELDDWLAPYRSMWSDSLDRLAQHLDAMPDEAPVPPSRPNRRARRRS
jgi:DNA-binding transcriptional ArsR family regulator